MRATLLAILLICHQAVAQPFSDEPIEVHNALEAIPSSEATATPQAQLPAEGQPKIDSIPMTPSNIAGNDTWSQYLSKEDTIAQWLMMIATVGTAAITAWVALLVKDTLKETRRIANDAKDATTAAQSAAEAANKANNVAQDLGEAQARAYPGISALSVWALRRERRLRFKLSITNAGASPLQNGVVIIQVFTEDKPTVVTTAIPLLSSKAEEALEQTYEKLVVPNTIFRTDEEAPTTTIRAKIAFGGIDVFRKQVTVVEEVFLTFVTPEARGQDVKAFVRRIAGELYIGRSLVDILGPETMQLLASAEDRQDASEAENN